VQQQLAMYLAFTTEGVADVITACNLQQQEYSLSFRNKIQKGFNVKDIADH
jgi:hypothetical protein